MVTMQVGNAQMSPREWIELLYVYGPFALLVLFMLVSQFIAHRNLKRSTPENRRIHQFVFVCNWLIIFGLVGFSLQAWYRNLDQTYEVTVRVKTEPENIGISEANIKPAVYDPYGVPIEIPPPNVRLSQDGMFIVPFGRLKARDLIEVNVVVDGEKRGTTGTITIPPNTIVPVRVSP